MGGLDNPSKTMAYVSFFPCLARLWNRLPFECFPLTLDLSSVTSRVNKHPLSLFFSTYTITRFQTKTLQSPDTYTSGRIWDLNQKAITK